MRLEHVVEPLPLFRRHSALASADLWPDQDGLVRRFDAYQDIAGASIPTVPGWLLSEPENRAQGNLIDFSIEPGTIPRISFADVLEGTFDLRGWQESECSSAPRPSSSGTR